MITVLDTCVGVDVALGKKDAADYLNRITAADLVIAPTFYITETANVFWKYYRMSGMTMEQCEESMEICISLPDEFVNDRDLYREAFSLAVLANKAVYDMCFLALARRNNAVLLTSDKELRQVAQKHSVRVV